MKPKANTSKFIQKMKKYAGDQSSTNQQTSGSFSRNFSSFNNTLPATTRHADNVSQEHLILVDSFDSLCQEIFTTHCLNVENSLMAISQSPALAETQVEGVQNCYFVEEKNFVTLMRLSKHSDSSILMEFVGVYPPSKL